MCPYPLPAHHTLSARALGAYIRQTTHAHDIPPYSGKVWRGETLTNLLFLSAWREKVWQMDR